jgi:hypothetical protein
VNAPRGWPLVLLAGAALAIAVYAGPNQGIATLLALLALGAIGLLLLAPGRAVASERRAARSTATPEPSSTFRAALAAGRSGRSEVVAQIDLVERRTVRPDRPRTSATEHARLRALPRSEFQEYVNARLETIEEAYQ